MLQTLKSKWFSALFLGIPFLALLWRAPSLDSHLSNADHGYQISMGKQILLGKFPFVDLFFHYGPLTAFISALGLGFSDSLIPETVICAFGYAAAIFLIHYFTRHYVSNRAGWLTPLFGFLLLSRFYKWYYWLFPLLALYGLHYFLNAKPKQQQYCLYIAGFLGAIGGLYRFDLGIVVFCFYLISLLGLSLKPLNLKLFSQRFGIFLMGFSLPWLLWFLILAFKGGTVQDYLNATLTGAKGAVEELSLPIPSFDWSNPLSPESSAALAFRLIPLTYILCVLYGFWMEFRHPEQSNLKFKFIALGGVLGLGIFPQALHRADIPHLLQVLPPVLITGSFLVSELWRGTVLSKDNDQGRLLLKCFATLYLAVAALSGWGIRDYGGSDLAQWNSNPIPRYQHLYQGIDSNLDHPVIRLMSEVHNQTKVDDTVLVVPWASQLYYFAARPISGLFNVFAPGILDTDEWRRRNLEAIQKQLPAVVIVNDGFFSLPPTDLFRKHQPELYAFLSHHYSQVIYQQDGWMLLSRSKTG